MPSRFLPLILTVLLTGAEALSQSTSTAKPATSLSKSPFKFHSSFWINLHHFLYAEASGVKLPSHSVELSDRDQQTWNEALSYYRQHFVSRDLLTDNQLEQLKIYLAKEGDAPAVGEAAGSELSGILNAAAPIYKQYWWPEHNAANQFWIHMAQPLIDALGPQMCTQLASAYQAQWPAQPVRVDVSVYANWAGAYTDTDPGGQIHTVIASENPGYQGFAALEMLFHEASHGLWHTGPLDAMLDAEAKTHGIPVPKNFWHALIFYTAGEFARRDLNAVGVYDYEPYADRNGLWHRGSWQDYQNVLSLYWRAYLDGKLPLREAISQMMSALALTARSPFAAP